MVANMAFTAFATGLLWSKHIFGSYLRCAILMQIHFFVQCLLRVKETQGNLERCDTEDPVVMKADCGVSLFSFVFRQPGYSSAIARDVL